ncbi:MAG: ATP-binding protein, partial [Clostridia bacterium]|nr:ATP-binding protein [Clostridia bacterium]
MGILLISQMRKAIKDYDMIQNKDCIAVGLSGGKDSLAMLYGLSLIRGHIEQSFEIKAVTLKMSSINPDTDYLKTFCDRINVELVIKQTDIEQIVFEVREEKSPCSLCANMR